MIRLESHPQGILLAVKAQPGSRQDAIKGWQDGALKVAVTQVAEKGKANRAIMQVLAKQLKLRKSQIELLRGETSSNKHFLIRDCSEDDLIRRIEATL